MGSAWVACWMGDGGLDILRQGCSERTLMDGGQVLEVSRSQTAATSIRGIGEPGNLGQGEPAPKRFGINAQQGTTGMLSDESHEYTPFKHASLRSASCRKNPGKLQGVEGNSRESREWKPGEHGKDYPALSRRLVWQEHACWRCHRRQADHARSRPT